jgi:hypothetical protein
LKLFSKAKQILGMQKTQMPNWRVFPDLVMTTIHYYGRLRSAENLQGVSTNFPFRHLEARFKARKCISEPGPQAIFFKCPDPVL